MAKAVANTVRVAPRKARLVIDLIRDKKVGEATSILKLTNRAITTDVEKLLNSAIANAVNNDGLNADDLYVTATYVNEGPTIKRWRPRARGSASQILKRTSHITIEVNTK